jgi:hypothetical protein
MRTRSRWQAAQRGNFARHSFFGGTGWLFADLMVALAMMFLVATTVGFPSPPEPKPTPAPAHHPVPAKSKPPNRPGPALDLNYVTITISNLDYNGLLNNSSAATASVRNAVLGNAAVRGRRAGLVLLFGGDNPQNALAVSLDQKISQILTGLGRQNYVFQVAVYRDFVDLAQPLSDFHMDVYLFKTS